MGSSKTRKILFSILAVLILLTASLAAIFTLQPKEAGAATPSDYWNGDLTQKEYYNTILGWGYQCGTPATVQSVDQSVTFPVSINTVQQSGTYNKYDGNFGVIYKGTGYIFYKTPRGSVGVKQLTTLKVGNPNAGDGSDTAYGSTDSDPISLMYPVFNSEGKTNIYVQVIGGNRYPYIKTYKGTGGLQDYIIYLTSNGPSQSTPSGGQGGLPTTTPLTGAQITLSQNSFTYNGSEQKPNVTSVTLGGKTLQAGTDYDVSYSPSSCTDAGTYTVTITGKGDYEGTASAQFTINKANWDITLPGSPASLDTSNKTGSFADQLSGNDKSGVTYTSSNDSVIKVESSTGNYEVVGAGDATITVSKAEDKNHNAFSASFNVEVTKAAGFYIGDTYYGDLQSAVNAANGSTTITVVGSPTVDSTVTIPERQKYHPHRR